MKQLHIILGILYIAAASCKTGSRNAITDLADYSKYLTVSGKPAGIQRIDEEIGYWNQRFAETPDDIIARAKIAGLLTERFTYSGQIAELHRADSLFALVNVLNKRNSSSTYRSLAANAIRQHKFRLAQAYIDTALQMGDDKYLSVLMEFDIAMELGNDKRAEKALNSLGNKSAFEYLIRRSKFEDQVRGNIDAAIEQLEIALTQVNGKNNPQLWLWTKSNLGDLYGHANRLKDSYQSYLDVLETDPHYFHALKGIAWIAFSNDRLTADAEKILFFLRLHHPVPDYDLALAEIAAFRADTALQQKYLSAFYDRSSDMMYGNMYNKYRFNLQADIWHNFAEAKRIAESEVAERPTGEAFSWLAWAQFVRGEKELALKTVQTFVEDRCFEPEALYYAGRIYAANGNKKQARRFLKEAQSSSFELGPELSAEITKALTDF